MKFKEKEYDREKMVGLIYGLLRNEAQKLPEEIKNKHVYELIGENWEKFVYNIHGFKLNSADLSGMIADELIKTLKLCEK